MSKIKFFEQVVEIQEKRPDWRFSLLGGDMPKELKRDKKGNIIGYKKTRSPFGWQAEFFTLKNGTRLQSGFYKDPNDAILIAVGKASMAIKKGLK
mgnify:CR=1 FL=1